MKTTSDRYAFRAEAARQGQFGAPRWRGRTGQGMGRISLELLLRLLDLGR